VSCSEWTGVTLAALLQEVGLEAAGEMDISRGCGCLPHGARYPGGQGSRRCDRCLRTEWGRASSAVQRLGACLYSSFPWFAGKASLIVCRIVPNAFAGTANNIVSPLIRYDGAGDPYWEVPRVRHCGRA
jgi:hypothetical protein